MSPRRRSTDSILEMLASDTLGAEEKLAALHTARRALPADALDEALLGRLLNYERGLQQARAMQEQLKALLERVTAEPWHFAVFLSAEDTPSGQHAYVACGDDHRLVTVAEGIRLEDLGTGDPVFLNHQLNLLVHPAPRSPHCTRETGSFARALPDGRLVIRFRDEEVIVHPAARLTTVELCEGDQLAWARDIGVAFERLQRPTDQRYRVTDRQTVGRELIGGQGPNVEELLSALTLGLVYPEKAIRYGLADKPQNVLLVGPPGNGKTLLARVAATELARLHGVEAQFFVVKPSEWEESWVGATEQNIRQCFAMLRDAANTGPVVLFLDEVEGIGRIRGSRVGQHADRALAAFLAELDGFAGSPRVVVISATNRKDLLDPALRERLSDIELQIKRPDRDGAEAILGIHLAESLLFATDTDRQELLDAALSQLYAPNAANALCKLAFRDGKDRTVRAADLMSGRQLRQICTEACRTAARRDCAGGAEGLCVADIEQAGERAMHRLATTLAPENARAYLDDLPQDVDVVSVQPIVRRVRRPDRYRNVA